MSGYQVTFEKEVCSVVISTKDYDLLGWTVFGWSLQAEAIQEFDGSRGIWQNSFQLWHRRLEHISVNDMKWLKYIATGIQFEEKYMEKCVP